VTIHRYRSRSNPDGYQRVQQMLPFTRLAQKGCCNHEHHPGIAIPAGAAFCSGDTSGCSTGRSMPPASSAARHPVR
jgi:hypothetical protein